MPCHTPMRRRCRLTWKFPHKFLMKVHSFSTYLCYFPLIGFFFCITTCWFRLGESWSADSQRQSTRTLSPISSIRVQWPTIRLGSFLDVTNWSWLFVIGWPPSRGPRSLVSFGHMWEFRVRDTSSLELLRHPTERQGIPALVWQTHVGGVTHHKSCTQILEFARWVAITSLAEQ